MLQNAQKTRENRRNELGTARNVLTMREVCAEASISLSALYKMRKRGFGPRVIRLDGAVRVSRVELAQWLQRHTEQTPGGDVPAYK